MLVQCGGVNPSLNDLALWNKLTWTQNTNPNLDVRVGLFQWDMTCVRSFCATSLPADVPLDPFCQAIANPAFDGVVVATNWQFTNAPLPDDFSYGVIFS